MTSTYLSCQNFTIADHCTGHVNLAVDPFCPEFIRVVIVPHLELGRMKSWQAERPTCTVDCQYSGKTRVSHLERWSCGTQRRPFVVAGRVLIGVSDKMSYATIVADELVSELQLKIYRFTRT